MSLLLFIITHGIVWVGSLPSKSCLPIFLISKFQAQIELKVQLRRGGSKKVANIMEQFHQIDEK